jgi:N-acetylneuraminic acid mutarotase
MKQTMTILTLVALAATSATAQGEWAYKTPIPTPRAYVTSCVLDNQIYVIGGGLTREEGSAAVERYDPETDTWDVTIAGLPVPHFAPASAVVNGKIYVMGGKVNYYSTEDYATLYEYDPVLNTWTEKTSMPTARSHLTACTVDGRIYVIGGRVDDHVSVKTVERYDPVADSWTTLPDMHQARANILAQVVGGKIYIVDGIGNGPWSVESYDPATNSWELEDNPPPAVGYFGSATYGGRIYVYGGINNTSPTASLDFFEFDPGTGLWENIGTIPEKKVMCANAVVGNRLYAITGALDPFFIPSLPGPATTASVIMYEFTPSAVKNMAAGFAPAALFQNYPNPFIRQTTIYYELSRPGHISLRVFDLHGREVARLVDGFQGAGEYTVAWNAREMPAGVYVYQLKMNEFTTAKKCVLTSIYH